MTNCRLKGLLSKVFSFIILAICGYSPVASIPKATARKETNQNSGGEAMQSSATAQIIGGTVSMETNWPWQATSIKIRAGVNNLGMKERTDQLLLVEKIIFYPSYSGTHSSNYIHDIAIILLKTPASINSATHPVSVPADDNMDFSESTLCYMTGWGLSDYGNTKQEVPTKLLEAKVRLISNLDCNKSVYWNGLIQPSQICAYNRNISACLGDSGGPLVCKVEKTFVLFGITSWGSQTCNNKPTVFTRISYYNSWIQTALPDADET